MKREQVSELHSYLTESIVSNEDNLIKVEDLYQEAIDQIQCLKEAFEYLKNYKHD